MTDNSSDKQILELLQINLGLEQNSEKLFDKLLKGKEGDPLDDIFKSMTNKNRQIENLRNQLAECQRELEKFKKERNPASHSHSMSMERQGEPRRKSLPEKHDEIKGNVDQKKKSLEEEKSKLRKRSEAFIIFLLKCIRELARAHAGRMEDVENLVDGFEKILVSEQRKSLQMQRELEGNSAKSEISTQVSTGSVDKAKKIVADLSAEKDPEKLFEKISAALGLEKVWTPFISKLKDESKLYYQLKNTILQPGQKPQLLHQPQPQIPLQTPQQTLTNSFYNIATLKIEDRIKQQTTQPALTGLIHQMLQDTKRQSRKAPEQAFEIIKYTMEYFYEKLDKMFVKHNQHPYEMGRRGNFGVVADRVRGLMVRGQWEQVRKELAADMDEAFRMIERRTKFYSANRVVVKQNY